MTRGNYGGGGSWGGGRRRCVSRSRRSKRGGYWDGLNLANNRPTDFRIVAAGGRRRCVSRSRSTRCKRGGVANDSEYIRVLAAPSETVLGGRRSTRCKRGGFKRYVPSSDAIWGGRRSTRGKRGGFNSEPVTLFSEPFAWKVYDRIK